MDTTNLILSIIVSVATGLLSAVIIDVIRRPKKVQFSLADLADASALVGRLRDGLDSVSQYLWWRIPPDIQTELKKFDNSRQPSQSLLQTVIAMLNQLLGDSNFFDERRFENVSLRKRTRKLISQDDDLATINRMLVEDAYPSEIVKRSLPKSPDAKIVATALAIVVFAVLTTFWSPAKVPNAEQVPTFEPRSPSVPTGSSTISVLGPMSPADTSRLIRVIKQLQHTYVGDSTGLEAIDNFSDAELAQFRTNKTFDQVLGSLKGNSEFLKAVEEMRSLPPAEREDQLRKAAATYRKPWQQIGLDPTINSPEELVRGQTRAGHIAEKIISEGTANLAMSLL